LKILHHRHPGDLKPQKALVLALGVYDGVHPGHQSILQRLVHWKNEEGLTPAVWTFRSPMPKPGFERIMGSEQLIRALDKEGVEELHTLEFMDEIRNMSAEEFILEILKNGLNVKVLVVGEDARMGKNRETSAEDLCFLGEKLGIRVELVPAVRFGNEDLSSTLIRKSLRNGKLDDVEAMLGKSYRVGGYVQKDQGKARSMGYPTANLSMKGRATLPNGVYSAWAYTPDGPLENKVKALVYLGVRPTVQGVDHVLEVHILDWEGDLYGRYLEVRGFELIRGELTFDSLEALSRQISLDIEAVKS